MIQTNALSFRYPGHRKTIFSSLTLSITPGYIYGLLGQNGVGKSTLFRLIAGINKPSEGSIQTLGYTPFDRNPEMLREIFLIPEDMTMPPVNILQYANLYGAFYPRFDWNELEQLLKKLDVPPNQKLSTMSLGQRKKAMIAFALACQTKILLMDEPTNGLDISSKRVFRDVLYRTRADDRLIIISTHQVRDLEQLIHAVIIVHEKSIILKDTVQNLLAHYHFGPISHGENPMYFEMAGDQKVGVLPLAPGDKEDTQIDLELLFNAAISGAFPYA